MSEVLFNTHDMVLLITIYQCILFAFFLLTLKKGKKTSNVLLACFFLCFAAIPLDTLINFGASFRASAIDFSPNIFYVFGNAYWIESVFLLFYVRSLIYKNFTFKKQDLLFLLPLAFYLAYETNNWYILDYQTKLDFLNGYRLENEPGYKFAINLFRELFRAYCSVMCLIELRRYQQQIKNEYADIEAVDLTWLKILVIGFLVVHVIAVITTLGFISVTVLHLLVDYSFIGLANNYVTLLLLSFLIFFSLGFSPVFMGISPQQHKASEKDVIAPEQINHIKEYMLSEKPYLNHLLTLENLARQLSIQPRALSQIINRHFQQNFFEFINGYRIEEAKQILSKPENKKITMLTVMDQAGFNSKATFNTFFKKLVGSTPSQFKKEVHK